MDIQTGINDSYNDNRKARGYRTFKIPYAFSQSGWKFLCGFFIVVTLIACNSKEQPQVTSKNELISYLDTLEQRYENACMQMGIANWNSYSKEGSYNLDEAKAELGKIFLDTTARHIIEKWRDKSDVLADKQLARRLELWNRCFIGGAIYANPEIAAIENSLQQKITNFKFKFKGSSITRAKLTTMMRGEKRQLARRALWSVTSQVSEIAAKDLTQLISLRNEQSKKHGFENYFSLALHLQSIDEKWLLKTLTDLEKQTRFAFEEFVASSKTTLHLKIFGPWDFDYSLRLTASLPDKYFPSDSVFTVIHRFQHGIGFPVDSLPIKEVIKDIPYGGLSLAIKIPTDSRFLVNPTKGKGFYAVAFHEYGHSLKAVHTNMKYPIFKGYEWVPGAQCAAYEEGVAEMHSEFTEDSLWLSMFTKATSKQIESYMMDRRIPSLYRLRRLLKDFFFEYEMYKHPQQDLVALERSMFNKYLLVELSEREPHQYASSIWYTSYPCYYQNYILAAMIATQLQEALTNKFGDSKFHNPDVASWIIEHLYSRGEYEEWMDRIRNATGKSLEPGAYLRKLGIEDTKSLTQDL